MLHLFGVKINNFSLFGVLGGRLGGALNASTVLFTTLLFFQHLLLGKFGAIFWKCTFLKLIKMQWPLHFFLSELSRIVVYTSKVGFEEVACRLIKVTCCPLRSAPTVFKMTIPCFLRQFIPTIHASTHDKLTDLISLFSSLFILWH